MEARELQKRAESIKLEYEGTDDTIQLLALQVWANIAVSLEHIVAIMSSAEDRAYWVQEGKQPTLDDPFRLG